MLPERTVLIGQKYDFSNSVWCFDRNFLRIIMKETLSKKVSYFNGLNSSKLIKDKMKFCPKNLEVDLLCHKKRLIFPIVYREGHIV